MLDLRPATDVLARLVQGVRDAQLGEPTPCVDMTVGDLLDHIDGLGLAFTAATKVPPADCPRGPSADASRLGDDWRTRIPVRLTALANAWRDQSAWEGMTEAGGLELPGEVAGIVALDEVVVHGWDLAVASGQEFTCDRELLNAVHQFARQTVAENPHGTPGLFGPPVAVPDDAPLLDRVLGLTGRDSAWRPAR